MSILPNQKKSVVRTLEKQIITIYGAPKAGKSSFAAQFDSPLFIATEPGLNALEVLEAPVSTWAEFLEVCKALATEKHQYKTLVIDTADNLYQFCEASVCEANQIKSPSDLPYGKGQALVYGEFSRVIKKLAMLPGIGLVFISHAKNKEVDTRTGKIIRTTLSLPDGAGKVILALSDMILFLDFEKGAAPGEERRVMRTRPSKTYDAGSRWELPDPIEMGSNPAESFANFKAAYEPKKEAQPINQLSKLAAAVSSSSRVVSTATVNKKGN